MSDGSLVLCFKDTLSLVYAHGTLSNPQSDGCSECEHVTKYQGNYQCHGHGWPHLRVAPRTDFQHWTVLMSESCQWAPTHARANGRAMSRFFSCRSLCVYIHYVFHVSLLLSVCTIPCALIGMEETLMFPCTCLSGLFHTGSSEVYHGGVFCILTGRPCKVTFGFFWHQRPWCSQCFNRLGIQGTPSIIQVVPGQISVFNLTCYGRCSGHVLHSRVAI